MADPQTTPDWQRFREEVSWFLEEGETAEVGEPGPWTRDPVDGLPQLSALLAEATVTPVAVGDRSYELLAWGPAERRRGWLALPPVADPPADLHPLHRELLTRFGGFCETFDAPVTWWSSTEEVLTLSAASSGMLAESLDAYSWAWEDEGLTIPVDPADFHLVALEASGILFAVERATGRLVVFAADHDYEGVTPLPGCPEYSLMTIDEAPDLASWVEVCAARWAGGGAELDE